MAFAAGVLLCFILHLLSGLGTARDDYRIWNIQDNRHLHTCLTSTSYEMLQMKNENACARKCLRDYPTCVAAVYQSVGKRCGLYSEYNPRTLVSGCTGKTLLVVNVTQVPDQTTTEIISADAVDEGVGLSCPGLDWHRLGSQCYLYQEVPVQFYEADTKCRLRGGQLVSIHNSQEQQFLSELVPDNQLLYMGLLKQSGLKANPSYVWTDGSEVNYEKWLPGEPANEPPLRSNCIKMATGSDKTGWQDGSCYEEHPFICRTYAA